MNLRIVLVLSIALATASCASSVPNVMRYHPVGKEVPQALVWPPAPETPRYEYQGVLTGEPNFGPSEQYRPGAGERVFRWLVGLGARLRGAERLLVRPQSGAVDAQGRIYVTDPGSAAVFVFDEPAGKLHIWDTADQYSNFVSPTGIAVTANEVLVSDSELGRIVRLDFDGNPLGSFGGELVERPTGLARDPATGLIYVADTRQHDIKVFAPDRQFVRRIGGPGSEAGQFNAPTHVAFMHGKLYISDTLNARVQVFSADGRPLRIIGRRGLYVGNLTRPKGVAADNDGNVYVIESYYDHLLIFSAEGKLLLPIGGTGKAVGQFFLPAGIWSDQRDRIFIADMFNGRVVIFRYLGA